VTLFFWTKNKQRKIKKTKKIIISTSSHKFEKKRKNNFFIVVFLLAQYLGNQAFCGKSKEFKIVLPHKKVQMSLFNSM
jgi:hypothetical protein